MKYLKRFENIEYDVDVFRNFGVIITHKHFLFKNFTDSDSIKHAIYILESKVINYNAYFDEVGNNLILITNSDYDKNYISKHELGFDTFSSFDWDEIERHGFMSIPKAVYKRIPINDIRKYYINIDSKKFGI